jgi:hypothetical protein
MKKKVVYQKSLLIPEIARFSRLKFREKLSDRDSGRVPLEGKPKLQVEEIHKRDYFKPLQRSGNYLYRFL